MKKKFKGIIVSHTHWDRAWYWSFQQFRIRLVQTLDQLIDILQNNEKYKSFTFDGQTVILEDYLEVKPEKMEILTNLIKRKKLLVGPWYILPDEFLVSGESLIRNLMLGHKIADSFGFIMKEGYIPDSFGHIQNLPQILNGFGIGSFIFARGITKEVKELGTEFYWESPDRSKVLAVNQRNSYCHLGSWGFENIWCNYKSLKPNPKAALERMKNEIKTLKPAANTDVLLFSNGCDHLPPQPELPELIEYVNKRLKDVQLYHGTFTDLVDQIKAYKPALKTYKGELLGNETNFILLSVYSTRMYLKQMNYYSQNLFERFVEPISALNRIEGGNDYSKHIWTGWKLILKNHPHDDICGSSIDENHVEMENRFTQANQVGLFVLNNCIEELANKINTAYRPGKPFIVFNSNSHSVTDKLIFDIHFELNDSLIKNFKILDNLGKEVPFIVLDTKEAMIMELFKEAKYKIVKIELLCRDMPPFGYRTYYIVESKRMNNSTNLKFSKNTIENEFFTIRAASNGSIDILDKSNNSIIEKCNIFEDTEDIGDEYTYSYSKSSKTITSENLKAEISIIDKRPVSVSLKICLLFPLPEQIEPNRQKRCKKTIPVPITSYINLTEGVRRIDITTEIDNKVKDHRLRVLFPTFIKSNKCFADGHFGVVERDAFYPNKPDFKNKFEYYGTRHQKDFVSISDEKLGLTIANKGLPEYEILNEKSGAVIALTLFRAVGWLSRGDLITRPNNAGPMLETPDAQCLGVNSYEYSIIPHDKDWFESKAYLAAYQFNTPLRGYNIKKNDGYLKDSHSIVNSSSDKIIFSSIKLSESGDGMIVRFYNLANERFNTYINVHKKIKNAFYTNLNEEKLEKLVKIKNSLLEIEVEPKRIYTLYFEF